MGRRAGEINSRFSFCLCFPCLRLCLNLMAFVSATYSVPRKEVPVYSDFLLIDNDAADPIRVERLAFGETGGRNEAWLRDTLLKYPELLPIHDLDHSFGPLIPICRELRTSAGPIDAVFINGHGRLTLVECKLWRNPEARRRVVAQILDYARVVSRWSYSEFQAQVSSATGRKGNVPFEIAREKVPDLNEQTFVDQVAACMRQGRFLLVIAGDGIREEVPELANLVNRHAAFGFSFGLVEVALFGMAGGELLVQPRVVAKTQLIERSIVVVRGTTVEVIDPDDAEAMEPSTGDQGETNEARRKSAASRLSALVATSN